jgi:hypothetical protein
MKSEIDFHQLVEAVENALGLDEKLIGIDGLDGIGKTPLANLLARRLNANVVSLDSYLVKNQNKYTDALNEQVNVDLLETKGVTIVEGVCLLAAAKRFGFELDFLVYLKRTHNSIWADEDVCDLSGSAEETISKEEDKVFIFKEWNSSNKNLEPPKREDVKLTGLRCELIHYHSEYQPHKFANLVLEVEHA